MLICDVSAVPHLRGVTGQNWEENLIVADIRVRIEYQKC
jgi:hypothetical protein